MVKTGSTRDNSEVSLVSYNDRASIATQEAMSDQISSFIDKENVPAQENQGNVSQSVPDALQVNMLVVTQNPVIIGYPHFPCPNANQGPSFTPNWNMFPVPAVNYSLSTSTASTTIYQPYYFNNSSVTIYSPRSNEANE